MIDEVMTDNLRRKESNWTNFKNYEIRKELCYNEEKTREKGKIWYSEYAVVYTNGAQQDKFPWGTSVDYIFEKLVESSIIKKFGSIENFLAWKSLDQSEIRRKARADKIQEDIIHNVETDRYLKGQHSMIVP